MPDNGTSQCTSAQRVLIINTLYLVINIKIIKNEKRVEQVSTESTCEMRNIRNDR